MHAGRVETSAPLKAVLAFLQLRGSSGATTWQIIEEAKVANPATEVSALRQNGFAILCKYEGKFNSRKVYRYTLLDSPITQGQLFSEGA